MQFTKTLGVRATGPRCTHVLPRAKRRHDYTQIFVFVAPVLFSIAFAVLWSFESVSIVGNILYLVTTFS